MTGSASGLFEIIVSSLFNMKKPTTGAISGL